MGAKNIGKKSSQNVRKNVFYSHTNVVTKKWGGENARNNFSRNTRIVRAKNVGKKIVVKKGKKRFLYSYDIVTKKRWGKKPRKYFSRNTRIVLAKNVGKESRKEVLKTFFIFTRIS